MRTYLPTEYKEKLLGIKSGEKVSCDNAMLICCELEFHYLQEIRKLQDQSKADNERLTAVIQKSIDALDRINQRHVFTHKIGRAHV